VWEIFEALLVTLPIEKALAMIAGTPGGQALAGEVAIMSNASDRARVRVRLKYLAGDQGPFEWSRVWSLRPDQIEHVSVVAIDYLARELKLDGLASPIVWLVEVTELRATSERGS
jgi:hypothetical protein